MFHHLRQINTIKYNQATQEATLRAGDVQPKCQQKTPPSITDSHRRCTPDDRKSKQGGGGERKLYLRNNILGGKDFSDLHS